MNFFNTIFWLAAKPIWPSFVKALRALVAGMEKLQASVLW